MQENNAGTKEEGGSMKPFESRALMIEHMLQSIPESGTFTFVGAKYFGGKWHLYTKIHPVKPSEKKCNTNGE